MIPLNSFYHVGGNFFYYEDKQTNINMIESPFEFKQNAGTQMLNCGGAIKWLEV
jgi:hypothetical protein